jgi:hypothetical protein
MAATDGMLEAGMHVEFLSAGRDTATLLPWSEVTWPVAVRIVKGQPVRKPVYYRGQWSRPGFYWMSSVGRHVTYESKLERQCLMEADFAGTVTDVLPQPFRLHFSRTERPYRHVPDYLFAHRDGRLEVVDVKASRQRHKPLNALTFALTEAACTAVGFDFRVFSEPSDVHGANVRFLAGYRSPLLSDLDAWSELLAVEAAGNAVTVGQLAAFLTRERGLSEPVAWAAVWRAMWSGALTAALLTQPLNTDMTVAVGNSVSLLDDALEGTVVA